VSQLTTDEILHYQRHLTLPGFGEAAQLKLKAARVLVVGAGGLGCPVLQYLAAAGVGTLGIVDDDVVSLSNLQRQILFTADQVGQPKGQCAAERLQAMNPHVRCVAHPFRLGLDNALELIGQYDLVVDGTDNFPTRYLINDACVLAGKPLIYGALYTFQGQASVFNYQGGPTYRCIFPEPPKPEDSPNCSEIGVVGVLPGLIGTIQATEAIKVLTGVGEPLSGKLLLWDALSMQPQVIRFKRVPEQAEVRELKLIEFTCSVAHKESVVDVEPTELQADTSDYQLLDVREGWEREICSLPGAHIPLGVILDGQADFAAAGLDPDKLTYVYCKGGVRSLKAAEAMQAEYGFKQLRNVRGGILAWAAQVDAGMQAY